MHPETQPSDGVSFSVFRLLLFHHTIILLMQPFGAQSDLICSHQPIVVLAGDDVILSCHLESPITASSETVVWTRPDLDPKYIHVHQEGRPMYQSQNPSYKNRTALFVDQLTNGNVSLKIFNVKISDAGKYFCILQSIQKEASIQLIVGVVSTPIIQFASDNSGSVVLQCDSKGWYPEPELLWLDGEGNLLSAGPTETVRGPDGLYTVSSRVTVEKRHSNSFTCRVQQKNINQTRETHIHVPDDFFPGPSSSSSSATIIGLVVGILFILAVVFVVWKWRQNRIRNKKHHEDEETQKVREKKRNSTSNNSEQESLMDREPDREQLTAERETVNDLDQFKEETGHETQTDNETRQRESNNVQCAVNKGTELQFSVEGGRQTDQRLAEGETENGLDKSEEETEAKPINERRDAPNPAARETESDLSNKEDETKSVSDNTEQPTGERQTENNLQTEEGEEEIKSTGDKTQVQCLMEEEEHGEQLTAERETPNDLDKEKETRVRKLKTKEREQKEFKKKVSRVEEQMKQKEEQIKQLKLQLEEVERQREETQRKIHSVNMEEDEEEAAEEEKDEAVKLLSDTMNDLERKKAELQKQLQKMETLLERMKKEKMITTEKIMSLTLSREKTENHSDPEDL